MYDLTFSKEYRKNIKKLRASGNFKEERLRSILRDLLDGKTLPLGANDHALLGNMKSFRECHIKGDLLLVYEIDEKIRLITLVSIGTHHQLFGA